MTYMDPTLRPDGQLMSDEQAILLRRLCEEAGHPEAFDPGLCSWRAACRIKGLIDDIRLRILPPHTD